MRVVIAEDSAILRDGLATLLVDRGHTVVAAVRDGDPIVLDVEARRLELDLPREEVARRLEDLTPRAPRYRRGYGQLFIDHVLQANEGCDFDFLRHLEGEEARRDPYGLLSGWIGGW